MYSSQILERLEPVDLGIQPFDPFGIAYGKGSRLQLGNPAQSDAPNSRLKAAWKSRQDGRGVPLLVVVLHNERANLWPAGEDPPVYMDLDPGQVERICGEALEQPNRQLRFAP